PEHPHCPLLARARPLNSVTFGTAVPHRKEPRAARPPGACGSHVVGTLAVDGDVQPLALFVLADAQAEDELDQVEPYGGHHRGPRDHHTHGLGLDEELSPDPRIRAAARSAQ